MPVVIASSRYRAKVTSRQRNVGSEEVSAWSPWTQDSEILELTLLLVGAEGVMQ